MSEKNIIQGSFRLGLFVLLLHSGISTRAQDTTKRRTIEITSAFKPVLREAVKINFNAAPPITDTSKPRLSYSIPAQYLFLSYQPGEMKPVAIRADTLAPWENYNWVKVGFGNVHIPYIRTGFSFGDGKNTFFNVFANQLNSKGNLSYQTNSLTDVKLVGTVKTANNLEWNGSIGFKNDGYSLYGYRPDTLNYSKEDLKQTFQTYEGRLSLRNIEPTEFGLLYHPNIKVSVFADNHNPKATESNAVLNLPLEKTFGKEYAFDLGFTADLTNYKVSSVPSIQNNVYWVTPAFLVKTQNLFLQASVAPSWDNKDFHLLPNFIANISTSDQRFGVQLGWIGYYDKGSYQRFESINPWLAQPGMLLNTRIQERYVGLKGSLDNHFSYSGKVGFLQYKNTPLFVNDTLNGGKQFLVRYESSMDVFQIHGEISYMQGEQFSATASVNFNQYNKLQTEPKPWGLLPVELNAAFKWQAFKDFWAKLDLFAFDGAQYRATNGASFKGDGALDLNAGVEFKITRQLNLWVQMNNIFNKKYERWHQYQVYGFNVLGGIVFSFGGK
ncbi:TonB-dependent receptor [Flavitalea flava]